VDTAVRAAAFTIAKDIDGDIKKIVPPILNHSRELQMDAEHMKSHPWFKYLPVTPKTPKIWDGVKRIAPKTEPETPQVAD
jgi:nitrite reductase (cytochrome c-552)